MSYSDDVEKIRSAADFGGHEATDYFKALCQLKDIAMELAAEKFRLSMTLAMMQGEPEPNEWRPFTARNSEEWGEVME